MANTALEFLGPVWSVGLGTVVGLWLD